MAVSFKETVDGLRRAVRWLQADEVERAVGRESAFDDCVRGGFGDGGEGAGVDGGENVLCVKPMRAKAALMLVEEMMVCAPSNMQSTCN